MRYLFTNLSFNAWLQGILRSFKHSPCIWRTPFVCRFHWCQVARPWPGELEVLGQD